MKTWCGLIMVLISHMKHCLPIIGQIPQIETLYIFLESWSFVESLCNNCFWIILMLWEHFVFVWPYSVISQLVVISTYIDAWLAEWSVHSPAVLWDLGLNPPQMAIRFSDFLAKANNVSVVLLYIHTHIYIRFCVCM